MPATASPGGTSTWVVRQADGLRLPWAARLVAEDGSARPVAGDLGPDDLPLGYHTLSGPAGEIRLVVCPGVCPIPRAHVGLGRAAVRRPVDGQLGDG